MTPEKLDYIVHHLREYLQGNPIQRRPQRVHKAVAPRQCNCCHATFTPTRTTAKYCGPACKARADAVSARRRGK